MIRRNLVSPFHSIRVRILGGPALVFIAVVAVGLGVRDAARQGSQAVDQARRSDGLQLTAQRVLGGVLSMETAVRGFVITGDEQFLTPYYQSAPVVRSNLSDLRARVSDDARQAARWSAIASMFEEWDQQWNAQLIDARRRVDPMLNALVATGAGKARVDFIRGQVANFDGDMGQARDAEIADTQLAFRHLSLAIILGAGAIGGVGIVLLVVSAGLIRRVRALRTATELVAAGDLNQTLPFRPDGDELDAVARAFGQMIVNLRSTVSHLEIARKEADQSAQEAQATADTLQTIFNTAIDGIVTTDGQGIITDANEAVGQMFGSRPSELIGQEFDTLMVVPLREGLQAESARYHATGDPRGFVVRREMAGRRRNGELFPLDLTAGGGTRPDGGVFFVTLLRDGTDRKRAEDELRAQAERLTQANNELESFAYSMAHDLRGPLRSISSFSEQLVRDHGDRLDEQGHERLARVRAAAQRMSAIIDTLQLLSRTSRAEMRIRTLDVSAIARSIASDLRQSATDRVVEILIAPDLQVDADAALTRALLQQLMSNAWKFSSGRERARIEFGAIDLDGTQVFYVRDNGAGFDSIYADKLFTPFQRLHAAGEFPGNGIGLAIAERIVRRYGGRIWAESTVNAGATFYFTLRAPPPAASSVGT